MASEGMGSTRLLVVGASTALALSVLLSPSVRRPIHRAVRRKKPLEHWIVDLRTASFTRLLAAFGPDGANAPGCEPGVMIASPSRPADHGRDENEDYFYQWTRAPRSSPFHQAEC